MTRGDSLPTVWKQEPHTKAKHDLLTGYLGAWFGILGSSQHYGRVIVFDGFAGPGRYDDGEKGSPVLALETLLNHSHFDRWGKTEFVFVFNERADDRYASLADTLQKLEQAQPGGGWPTNVRVHHRNESFSGLAEGLLAGLEENGAKLAPTFAFIDPFGYKDVPLDLIKRLVSSDACELFMYFDFNSVTRFSTAGVVDKHFEALFGTDEFKDAPPAGDPARPTFLHDLYERQLREGCDFAYVQSFAMVNKGGRIGNYMFFCTRNLKAFDRMKSTMWKLAPSGDYTFEDRFAGQDVLFADVRDTEPLKAALLEHFAGQTVSIETITQYTIASTPFYSGQLKRDTLAPMQKAGQISGGPNQRRPGQFPDGTLVVFPG